MKKSWMIGTAVITASIVVAAWTCRPVNPQNELLEKAQSEFAIKAREAFIQRKMPVPATSEVDSEPVSQPIQPYVVASLAPVAPPTKAAPDGTATTSAPSANAASANVPAASAASPIAEPVQPAAAPGQFLSAAEALAIASRHADAEPLSAAPVASPASEPIASPQAILEPALAATAAPAMTPAGVAAQEPVKASEKTMPMPVKSKANSGVRHVERSISRHTIPYNLNALRARAPGIAAAIARYM